MIDPRLQIKPGPKSFTAKVSKIDAYKVEVGESSPA